MACFIKYCPFRDTYECHHHSWYQDGIRSDIIQSSKCWRKLREWLWYRPDILSPFVITLLASPPLLLASGYCIVYRNGSPVSAAGAVPCGYAATSLPSQLGGSVAAPGAKSFCKLKWQVSFIFHPISISPYSCCLSSSLSPSHSIYFPAPLSFRPCLLSPNPILNFTSKDLS